jgi:hypothetical protein
VLDIQDDAIMLVDDNGHRRGPFEQGHIQDQLDDGALVNIGQAAPQLIKYFKAIDSGTAGGGQ